jgi:hypothetical protein
MTELKTGMCVLVAIDKLPAAFCRAGRRVFISTQATNEEAVLDGLLGILSSCRQSLLTMHGAHGAGFSYNLAAIVIVAAADDGVTNSSFGLTAFRLRADGAIVAFVPGTELWRVFAEILQTGVHPVDADSRLGEILFTTRLIEVRCHALELFRDTLLAASGSGFCLLIKHLRQADAVAFVDWCSRRCGNGLLFLCGRGLMSCRNPLLPVFCRSGGCRGRAK